MPPPQGTASVGMPQQCMDWDCPQQHQSHHLQQQQLPRGSDVSQVPRLPPLASRVGSQGSRGASSAAGGGAAAVPFKRPLEDSGSGDQGTTFLQRAGSDWPTAVAPPVTHGGNRAPLRPRNGSVMQARTAASAMVQPLAVPPQVVTTDPHQVLQLQQPVAPQGRFQGFVSSHQGLAPQPSSTWLPLITSGDAPVGVGTSGHGAAQWPQGRPQRRSQQQSHQPAAASESPLHTPMMPGEVMPPPAADVSAASFLEAVAECQELLRVLAWLMRRCLLPVPGDLVGTLAHMYVLCRRAAEGAGEAPSGTTGAAPAGSLDVPARVREPDWLLTLLWVVESVSSQYRCQLAGEVLPSYLEAMAAGGGSGGGTCPDAAASSDVEDEGVDGSAGAEDEEDDSDTEYDGSCTVRRCRSPAPPLPGALAVVCGRSARWWRRRLVSNQLQLLISCGWHVTITSSQLAEATADLVTAERRLAPATGVFGGAAVYAYAAVGYCTPPPTVSGPGTTDGAGRHSTGAVSGSGMVMLGSGGGSSQQNRKGPQGLARWFSSSAAVAPAPPPAGAPGSTASAGRPVSAARFPAAAASYLLGGSNGAAAASGRSITEPGCGRQQAVPPSQGLLPSLCRALSVPSPLLAGFRRSSRSTGGGGSNSGACCEVTAVPSSRGASDAGAQQGASAGAPVPPSGSGRCMPHAAGPVGALGGVCAMMLLPLVSRRVEQAGRNSSADMPAGKAASGQQVVNVAQQPAATDAGRTASRAMGGLLGLQPAGLRDERQLDRYEYEYEESFLAERQQQAEQCAAASVWAC